MAAFVCSSLETKQLSSLISCGCFHCPVSVSFLRVCALISVLIVSTHTQRTRSTYKFNIQGQHTRSGREQFEAAFHQHFYAG